MNIPIRLDPVDQWLLFPSNGEIKKTIKQMVNLFFPHYYVISAFSASFCGFLFAFLRGGISTAENAVGKEIFTQIFPSV